MIYTLRPHTRPLTGRPAGAQTWPRQGAGEIRNQKSRPDLPVDAGSDPRYHSRIFGYRDSAHAKGGRYGSPLNTARSAQQWLSAPLGAFVFKAISATSADSATPTTTLGQFRKRAKRTRKLCRMRDTKTVATFCKGYYSDRMTTGKQLTCAKCGEPLRCAACDGRRGGKAGSVAAKSAAATRRWQAFHALLLAATNQPTTTRRATK